MDSSKKLPEAEFDVMVALWNSKTLPINTAYLMENVGKAKGWKAPTLISFLTRLEDRGEAIVTSGSYQRYYYVDAIKTEYVRNITLEFLNRYHDGSFVNMLDLLYGNNSFSGDELEKLLKWLQEQY